MTAAGLQSTYDSGMQLFAAATATTKEVPGIVSAKPTGTGATYCISAQDAGNWAHVNGPGGQVVSDPSSVTADPCP
jgi:hypothetical protein